MKVLEDQLPESKFIRIHNSYIVAYDAIEAIERDRLQIGEVFLPVSESYRKAFREFLDKHQVGG